MTAKTFITISRICAGLAAILALLAAVSGISSITDADNATKMVETWRTIGFFTFTALFALLAARPVQSLTLWIVVIGNKVLLSIFGLAYGSSVEGALSSAGWDIALSIILIVGYIAAYKGSAASVTTKK